MTSYVITVSTAEGLLEIRIPNHIRGWARINGVKIKGDNMNPSQRYELQGEPKLEGFLGPMWGGDGTIRYEDGAAYRELST